MGGVMGDREQRIEPDPNWARLRELLKQKPEPGMLLFDRDGQLIGLAGERPTLRAPLPPPVPPPTPFDPLDAILNTEELVVTVGADRRIRAANDAMASAMGVPASELVGRDLLEGIDAPLRDSLGFRFTWGLSRPGAVSQMVTAPVNRPDGRIVWIEAQATNLIGDPTIGAVVVRGRDVTPQHELPEASIPFLSDDVVELLPTALVAVNENLVIMKVNKAFCAFIGRPDSELNGHHLTSFVHPDDIAAYAVHHANAVHHTLPYRHELRFLLIDGRDVWALMTGSPTPSGEHVIVINQVIDVTDTKRIVDELAHAATNDDLTGLPNRAMLDDRANQALARQRRHGGIVAVIYLDLDWFKPVNDLHKWGHQAGDLALRELAQRVRDAIRPTDTAARYGGDEFIVVCGDFTSIEDVDQVALRIFDAVHTPIDIGGMRVVVGASIGVVVVPEGLDTDWDAVRAAADDAMFRAKEAGKGRVVRVQLEAAS